MTSVPRFIAPAVVALVMAACATSRVPEDGVMGNTNWLASCESSDDCDDGTQCVCGVCTLECASSNECTELTGSVCDSSSDALASACGAAMPQRGLCLPECSDTTPCGDGQRCVDGYCLPEARVIDPSDGGSTCFAVPICAGSETTFATEELCQAQSDACRESSLCGVSVWCAETDSTNCDADPACDAGETSHASADECELESDVCREVSICGSSVWCGEELLNCNAAPSCEAWEVGYASAAECEQVSDACRAESECGSTIWCSAVCAPSLVDFNDECSLAVSYYWNGYACIDSRGCTCEGPDCDAGFSTVEECVDAHSACAAAVPCGGFTGNGCKDDEYCAYIPADDDCGALDGNATCQPRPDACDGNYDPVCGCDRETYGNACTAAMAGVGLSAFGECP